jgi:hypothetical protein
MFVKSGYELTQRHDIRVRPQGMYFPRSGRRTVLILGHHMTRDTVRLMKANNPRGLYDCSEEMCLLFSSDSIEDGLEELSCR